MSEIFAGKGENCGNPDGFQGFLTLSSGNLRHGDTYGDLFSGSLKSTHGKAADRRHRKEQRFHRKDGDPRSAPPPAPAWAGAAPCRQRRRRAAAARRDGASPGGPPGPALRPGSTGLTFPNRRTWGTGPLLHKSICMAVRFAPPSAYQADNRKSTGRKGGVHPVGGAGHKGRPVRRRAAPPVLGGRQAVPCYS